MPRRLLTSLCLALTIAALGACGGDDRAERILRQTFRSDTAALHDGYLSLSVRVIPHAASAARELIAVTLLGPFTTARAGAPERFDTELATMLPEGTSVAHVRSTGRGIVVTPEAGAGADAVQALARRLRARPAAGGLPVVGFDASRWIREPGWRRAERAAGVRTLRVGGTVDVRRLLADVDALVGGARRSRARVAAVLSPRLRRAVVGAVQSSSIDVWTGASDRLLRQIAARVTFAFGRRPARLRGLAGAKLEVHVRIDHVNARGRRAAAAR
jgi:hypothetical protein